MNLAEILQLTPQGPDTWVGTGPRYPWGGLYGGQIVAQALRAAAGTVETEYRPHSLRAYFIRRGDHHEPVRYEVERLRNGRSFCTRRVVARQATGAVLNLEASFAVAEDSVDLEAVTADPSIPGFDGDLETSSWSPTFERRFVPEPAEGATEGGRGGRATAWMRTTETLADDAYLHAAAIAFLSDDLPTDAVVRAHPVSALPADLVEGRVWTASLDHTIWFHRPLRADRWHLQDFTCRTFVGGRGLAIGHLFSDDGVHAATVAQEVLLRDRGAA